ncbi:chemotactic transducer-related protein [Marinobacter lipolyticus SM19]|uniref:Chemotactic transducer-related protein n=1 Tax=Marinobacter lipolyticus SM19 TaxID=1318628 RepID=R8AZC9_9GAMM|nr:HD domain-containing phosphohydrolase [Marinobacter lipolyticus]EON91703.1 chemotactic transducer-related protein [Marinobacter lipolyticus SM19]
MSAKHQSAQVSLAFLIASAITLGMLTLTIVLVGQSFRGMEAAKVSAASATAKQLAVSVDDRIRAITGPPAAALAVLGHDPLAKTDSLEQRLARLPVIADILTSSDIVSAVYAGYGDGDFFLLRKVRESEVSRFPDAPSNTRFLLQTITRDSEGRRHPEWHFYDQDRTLISREYPETYEFDPRSRPWYQQAKISGITELTDPYVFFTTRETGLTLSRRATGDGDSGAVFGVDVTVSDLSQQLAELRHTPGTRIGIVNREGAVLAYSNTDQSLSTDTNGAGPVQVDNLPHPALADAMARAQTDGDRHGVSRYTSANRDWYGMTEPLASLDGEGLTIAVAIPADELLADVWSALSRQTVMAGAIALLLLIIGWLLGRRVGKPLERLTDRVSSLSRFRFDTSIKVDSHIREARQLSVALDDMASTIHSFQNIATVLNRGQDLNTLLRDILDQIVHIVGQNRGAIYLFSRQNSELTLAVDRDLNLPPTVNEVRSDADDSDIIKHLRQLLPGHPVFAILRNRQKQLIGAMVIEMEHGDHTHLSDDLIVFVDEIAGSAAVAIETRELIESQQALLEGIIRLVANAIDAKSPYTGGHCDRVPKLAQMLVDEAEKSTEAPFRDFQLNDEQRYEFHLAAWLHDCGKITSPEYVVDKAVKLETIHNRIHEIRTRFEVLHRDVEIDCLTAILDGEDADHARQQRDQAQQSLQEEFAFIAKANIGGEFMDDADIARIRNIAGRRWLRHFSDRIGLSSDEHQALEGIPEEALPATETLLADKPSHLREWGNQVPPVQKDDPRNRWGFDMKLPEYAFNRGEVHNLTIAKGTLTDEDRFKINEHIVQTICMLDALPLPDRLANVPHLAGTHHERMDGKGYPCGLNSNDMGIPERIMAVADVFEALTAVDRPYKDGKTLTQALTIMARMVEDGHIDRPVFELFVRSGTYRRYGEQHLRPEQIDEVDESQFMKAD